MGAGSVICVGSQVMAPLIFTRRATPMNWVQPWPQRFHPSFRNFNLRPHIVHSIFKSNLLSGSNLRPLPHGRSLSEVLFLRSKNKAEDACPQRGRRSCEA